MPFAANANYGWEALYLPICVGALGATGIAEAFEDGGFDVGTFLLAIAMLVGAAAVCVYLLRGRGPTTKAVEKALAERREAADDTASKAAEMRRRGAPFIGVNVAAPDVARAAQVNAVANPETAVALQNLQNLLYTQAITEEEYQRGKDKLLGVHPAIADSFAQITKLSELHRAGVLSDVEFAAAKARALGL